MYINISRCKVCEAVPEMLRLSIYFSVHSDLVLERTLYHFSKEGFKQIIC